MLNTEIEGNQVSTRVSVLNTMQFSPQVLKNDKYDRRNSPGLFSKFETFNYVNRPFDFILIELTDKF